MKRGWQFILLRAWNKPLAGSGVKGLYLSEIVAERPGFALSVVPPGTPLHVLLSNTS